MKVHARITIPIAQEAVDGLNKIGKDMSFLVAAEKAIVMTELRGAMESVARGEIENGVHGDMKLDIHSIRLMEDGSPIEWLIFGENQ